MQLEGKVALITGAGSGLGKATALLLAREGAKVTVLMELSRSCKVELVERNERRRLASYGRE